MPFHTLRRLGARLSSAARCLFARSESPEERYRDFNGRYFSGFYEQERMLADQPRMKFYHAAIQRHIQPGDRVIVSPAMSTDDARARFGEVEEVKPYLRWTPQPKA